MRTNAYGLHALIVRLLNDPMHRIRGPVMQLFDTFTMHAWFDNRLVLLIIPLKQTL